MKAEKKRNIGPGALELIEEAIHLLRRAPAQVLASYYFGSLPFVLFLLYFWSDMSRSAYAERRCASLSLALALVFVWMKVWQTVFCRQLRAQAAGEFAPRWTLSKLIRAALRQAMIQPLGLIAIPVAGLITIPFGWVFAFFQNFTITEDGEEVGLRKALDRAAILVRLWQKQNLVILATLSLFGLFVCINLTVASAEIPMLLKTLLGVETAFTRGMRFLFNTTFWTAIFGMTYLCVDPVVKAVYVLRCFYGESITTGEDLKAELRMSLLSVKAVALALAVLLLSGGATKAAEAGTAAPDPATAKAVPAVSPSVSVPQLDQEIEKVLRHEEFTWRLPREKLSDSDQPKGPFDRFMDSLRETMGAWWDNIKSWVKAGFKPFRNFLKWLEEKLSRNASENPSIHGPSGSGWITSLQIFLLVLLALVLSALVILLLRAWKRRPISAAVATSQPVNLVPNLEDENVAADQLPEDGWLKLARELIAAGELRLALRALYLASLAHLAAREMITIAKFKSNRDYESEVLRRAKALPDLQSAFTQNVAVFDRVWYGAHQVTGEVLQNFQGNFERIRAC